MPVTAHRRANEPYCSNCGYTLEHLTESAKCPECGRPVVEVLVRAPAPPMTGGRRYRSRATIFGRPVLHLALGPGDGEPRGKARGFIAIGDDALGVLAVGGMARGVCAIGGVALGGVTLGGVGVGLISIGGAAIGLLAAAGGLAVGTLASGGGAVGIIASGGGALGWFARGGGAAGVHTINATTANPTGSAADVFAAMHWFFGPWPPTGVNAYYTMILLGLATAACAALIALVAAIRAAKP